MKKYPWFEDLDGILLCPSCEHRVDNITVDEMFFDDDNFPKFCPYCGQELDWSKTVRFGVLESHE